MRVLQCEHRGGTTTDATAIDSIHGSVDRAHDTFVAGGIPVIVGECGLLAVDDEWTPSSAARCRTIARRLQRPSSQKSF